MPADSPSENAVERALRLANGAKAKGFIGDYAIAGAFAFIYYCEPFETKQRGLRRDEVVSRQGSICQQFLPLGEARHRPKASSGFR